MTRLPPTISVNDFDSFRVRQRRRWFAAFLCLIVAAAGTAYGLAAAGAMPVGVLVAVAIALGGYELLRRWNRRRWLKRFPELINISFRWRVR